MTPERPLQEKHSKRLRYYREQAHAASLISADYNQQVLGDFYRRLDPRVVRSIADVGSGMGRNLELLGRSFPSARLFSMDLSLMALSSGRLAAASVAPTVADALRLPLRGAAVDLVVCTEVLEHVADLRAAVGELARILPSAGHCIISSPNYLNPMGLRKWHKDKRLGAEFWDPWGGHEGYERLMLPWLVDGAVRPWFETLEVRGAGYLMAWTALGYRRVGKKNDRYPMLRLGRIPGIRHLAMNRYLLLRRKGDAAHG